MQISLWHLSNHSPTPLLAQPCPKLAVLFDTLTGHKMPMSWGNETKLIKYFIEM